jgi:hypothetical protein
MGSLALPAKAASKTADFTIGQRVLFRVRARPALWLSGSVIGSPRSKQGRAFYQVKLDNGESRWVRTDQLRNAQLCVSHSPKEIPLARSAAG